MNAASVYIYLPNTLSIPHLTPYSTGYIIDLRHSRLDTAAFIAIHLAALSGLPGSSVNGGCSHAASRAQPRPRSAIEPTHCDSSGLRSVRHVRPRRLRAPPQEGPLPARQSPTRPPAARLIKPVTVTTPPRRQRRNPTTDHRPRNRNHHETITRSRHPQPPPRLTKNQDDMATDTCVVALMLSHLRCLTCGASPALPHLRCLICAVSSV